MRTESKVAQVLRTSPKKSASIDTLAEKMDLTTHEVRGCIDKSRAHGENIVNIGYREFQWKEGPYVGRGRGYGG